MIKKYFVVNVETGEKIEVLAHTAGEGTFSFARAELAGKPEWETVSAEEMFTFPNIDKDGKFAEDHNSTLDVTGKWDFVAEEVEDSENLG